MIRFQLVCAGVFVGVNALRPRGDSALECGRDSYAYVKGVVRKPRGTCVVCVCVCVRVCAW